MVPSCAILASNAFSRFFMFSRSWRCQTQRTPNGQIDSLRFQQFACWLACGVMAPVAPGPSLGIPLAPAALPGDRDGRHQAGGSLSVPDAITPPLSSRSLEPDLMANVRTLCQAHFGPRSAQRRSQG